MNTLETATDLGSISSPRDISSVFDSSDQIDFYRFSLPQNSDFAVAHSGARININLFSDINGNGIIESNESTRSDSFFLNENFTEPLPAGDYFIRASTGQFGSYSLRLAPTFRPGNLPTDPGGNINQALNIGLLNRRRNVADYIGDLDPSDFYQFTLPQNSNLGLTFSGSNRTDINVIADLNNNGIVDDGEIPLGSNFGAPSLSTDLPAGNYFIQVSGAETNYGIGLTPVAEPGTLPRDPGNTLSQALNIGRLSGRRILRDYVGVLDGADFYQFTLSENSNLGVDFTGSNRTDIAILADRNNNGVIESSEVVFREGFGRDFSLDLSAGTYFIQVDGATTNYGLDITQTPDRSGDDTILGTPGPDNLAGGPGNDRVFGGNGNDFLRGDEGNDQLQGNNGNDRLVGGVGNDLLSGGAGNDTLIASAGNNILAGGFGNDNLIGGNGNDQLYSGAGNDNLFGGNGVDVLVGGPGNDLLYGAGGNDIIRTDAGSDRIRLQPGAGFDRVVDFQDGQDRILLTGVSFNQLGISQQQSNVLILAGGNAGLVLANTSVNAITQADFV
ncbi:MAG: calcium-binding protein [Elainellaceae cyanobacterium]